MSAEYTQAASAPGQRRWSRASAAVTITSPIMGKRNLVVKGSSRAGSS